jgi:hypothetical protein
MITENSIVFRKCPSMHWPAMEYANLPLFAIIFRVRTRIQKFFLSLHIIYKKN